MEGIMLQKRNILDNDINKSKNSVIESLNTDKKEGYSEQKKIYSVIEQCQDCKEKLQ